MVAEVRVDRALVKAAIHRDDVIAIYSEVERLASSMSYKDARLVVALGHARAIVSDGQDEPGKEVTLKTAARLL